MAKRRRQWSLCLLLALALLCLLASIRTLKPLHELYGIITPVGGTWKSSYSDDEAEPTIHDHRQSDDLHNILTNTTSSRPWKIRNVEPLPQTTGVACDSRPPPQWPEWMSSSKKSIEQTRKSTYRSILQEFPRPLNVDQPVDLPIPLQILEDYREQHSVQSLTRNPGCRKFLVATYRCPLSAGNRLHEFANSYFWAVLLNRTLLYKYMDTPYCIKLQKRFHFVNEAIQCTVNNTIEDCAKILERAPWIASFDEWQDRLGLPNIEYMTTNDFGPQSSHKPSNMGIDVAYSEVHVLAVRPVSRRFDAFARFPETRELKFNHKATLQRVESLFSMGHRFLFGLLLRSAFDLQPELRDQKQAASATSSQSLKPFTMAIHSRHVSADDNGCNITLEEECIRKVQGRVRAEFGRSAHHPCTIALMSDRPCTLSAVQAYFANQTTGGMNCSVLVADHAQAMGLLSEHGPFAGAGFFQDLALASSVARDAMIGSSQPPQYSTWRTSSELLEELIEYNRFMEVWQQGNDPSQVPEMIRCGLRRR